MLEMIEFFMKGGDKCARESGARKECAHGRHRRRKTAAVLRIIAEARSFRSVDFTMALRPTAPRMAKDNGWDRGVV
jgi:hypothetical protein